MNSLVDKNRKKNGKRRNYYTDSQKGCQKDSKGSGAAEIIQQGGQAGSGQQRYDSTPKLRHA